MADDDLVKEIDPGQITISFKGKDIVGVAKGTFVEVERAEDGWKMHVGSRGTTTRIRNRNKTGSVTVTLGQASPSNDDLSVIAALDEDAGGGVGELLVKDLNGTTVYRATAAWIRKYAKGEHSDEHTDRVWVFDCAKLEKVVGGSAISYGV